MSPDVPPRLQRNRALRALLLALILVVPASVLLSRDPVTSADSSVISRSEFAYWTGQRPTLADVDGDGHPEIVAMNKNGRVYVIDPVDRSVEATLRPEVRADGPPWSFNGPKAADLDGDGRVEIVAATSSSVLTVWSRDPATGAYEKQWSRGLHDEAYTTMDAPPVLGDLTGDGRLEIVAQTEGRGLYAVKADGTLLWSRAEHGGNAEALLHDMNGDGALDAVFFNDGGKVWVVDGPTGDLLWGFRAKEDHGVWPGSAASPGAITDADGDGTPEVYYCIRNLEASSPTRLGAPLGAHHFALIAVEDGELQWLRKPDWGNSLCSAYLIAHDVTGDGRPEILGMDWNTIGHKPGNWQRTGAAYAFAFTADGDELWHAAVDARTAKHPVVLVDLHGDGTPEMIAYERGGTGDRLVVLDATNGDRVRTVGLGGWSVEQGPMVADLTGTGTMNLLVAVGKGGRHGFTVLDLPEGTTALWPGWEPPVLDPPDPPEPLTDRVDPPDPGPGDHDSTPDGSGGDTGETPDPVGSDAPDPQSSRERGAPAAGALGAGAAAVVAAVLTAFPKRRRRP